MEKLRIMFKNFFRQAWEIAKIIVVSLAIIIPVRYFLVQPFLVKGSSMEPNFQDGNYLLIDEISPRLRDYGRGDIIVFRFPQNHGIYLIKRIIGLPGEEVEIDNGRIYVWDAVGLKKIALIEPYLANGVLTLGSSRITLGQNEYFVLGDNRAASSDSRSWGSVKKDNIVGKVWLRAWPIAEAGFFETPNYRP
ncbi:MAG: signal peptidase I [Parcubacteria group bacterium]|nr:signal peptidase I [Parcubacteria group bacterium]